ncbi:DUF1542 domain-containing protein [uncultured Fructobacillus sp.]|uniref:DUF1542 domain-containing protein n=1 Tax=uncultured Fructobacillus sp. TaxID=591942 RepID=UPI0025915B5A|nr:DUF1542 domain-containing protein [uncultured Fructobacillus sp.]
MEIRVNKFQERTHFKMYKSGKQWLVAGMATFALVGATQVITGHAPIDFGQNITAHAADSTTTYWMGQNTEYYKRYTELPDNSSVPKSRQMKWGYASDEIPKLASQSSFKYTSLTYDKGTGKYTLTAVLDVPMLATNGSGRTSYFDMGFSNSLASKTGNPILTAANGSVTTLQPTDGVYQNQFNAGGNVGGKSVITVQINPVKIQQDDKITAMFSSDTGTTGYHAIFSVVRTMGYADFGLPFNQALLTQMKQNSMNAINNSKLSDKQKAAEQAKVNAVTTDDDFVNKLQGIDKEVASKSAANGVPIDQQRATALQQYKDAHNVTNILNEIANDQTLTADQKAAQTKQVNDAVAVIKGNLAKATDSDDVATAIADTSQDQPIATAYKPGTNLATQIKNAQDAVDAQVVKSKALVDNNTALTDDQKSAQKKALDTAAATAKANIGSQTSADGINTAQTAGVKSLTDLDTAKPVAYSTLAAKANKAISTINNDQNLTDAQKQDRINQVNTALKGITDQIDQATDATTVNNLAASTDLDKAISTATSDDGVTPVTTQRDNANKQIDGYVAETKSKIDADTNLTTTEKATQKANVDKAASEAKAAIANGSAQVITDTVSKAQGTIAGSYVAGKPLPDRQKDAETALNNAAAAAKSNLDAQVAQANNDINNNNYLTDAQKAAQKQAIQDAVNAAIAKINAATNAYDVNTALDNGQNVVNNLNAQKLAARTSVNNEAKQAEDAINANPALTATDKANRVAQIEAAKTAAGDAIDSATDADVIAKVPASGQTFDNAVKAASDLTGVKSISDQQTAAKEQLDSAGTTAKSAIDQAATAQENAIDQNGNLTPEQKTAQKAALDQSVANAKAAIDSATTADAINQAKQSGLDKVNALNEDKIAARKALAQQAQAAIDSINNNNALTSDEKKSRVQAVQNAYNAATTTVDNATDASIISAVPASGSTFDQAVKVATDFSNVKSVAEQQADAKAALDSAGTTAKSVIDQAATAQENTIDQDGNLTPEQKAAQKAALDQAVANAKAAIDAAQTADAINQAKQTGLDNINGLNNEKTAARKALAQQAQAAIDTINGNNALTAADKASRIKQVQDAYNIATGNVDAATKAADLTAAQNSADFTNAIKSATNFSNVPSLDGQKDAAKAALDNAGQAAKNALDAAKAAQENAIDQDGNLTPEQKAAQKAAIDQAVTNAKSNISNATNADDVTKAKDAAVTAISNLSGEKTVARQALAQQAQAAIDTINGNNALTAADKASRIKQVEDAYNTATSAVDAATTADGVTAAQNSADFTNAIKAATDFSNVTSLSDQKAAADKAVDDAATAIKAKIDADSNLSDTDKTAQKSTVDSVATAQKGVIDSATKADDVATAKDVGIQAVNNLDKTDGNASLTKQANDAKSAINSNATLTQAAKDDFNKQIDAAKSTAQNAINKATNPTAVQQDTSSDSDYAKSLANILKQANQTQQATAEKAIDAANTAAKAKVDADKNLSDADKAAQKAALDTVANQAKAAIQQATTADAINQAQTNGTNALSIMDKTADDESVAKQEADAHTVVNNNSALTQAQKDAFNKQIDDAKNAAQDIVNKATDPTTASAAVDPQNSDYAKQLATIAKQVSAVPSLDSQKETADQAIDNAANTVKSGIDADKNLSDADKAAQKAVVDSQVTAPKQAIANANNADDVNTAQAQGVKTINDLANAKTSADETIASAVQAAHDAINNNPALSTAEKASRNAAIDSAASKVQGVVNQATTPDAVNAAIADSSDFKTALSGATDTSGVKTIAQQQADAEKAIDDANTAAKAKVDADPSISDAGKAAQKATLDGLANTAKQNIQNAQTADDITNAQNAGVKSLDDLDKTTADKQLSDKVAQAHATVNGNNDLSQAEKDARNQAIDAAAKTAQDAINKATNLDDVTKALANGADFDSAVSKAISTTGVTPLADQKTAAVKAIDDAVTAAKSKIDDDPSISDADKQAQKTIIDDLANKAKANINAATNADGVIAAKTEGVNSIANLDKTPVDADLAKQIQAAHAAVNGNPALSAAEKQARNQAIDTAAKPAQDAVNAATTIDDANAVIASGSALDNALKSATSNDGVKTVAEQQAAAVQAIKDALAKVEAQIDADKTLTDADKQAQKTVASKQAEDAIANINKANNADDIATAQKAGIDALNKLEDAKMTTDASLADKVKAAEESINSNKALTSDQKTDRLNALHQAQAATQEAINKATDPDAVAEVIADGLDFAKAVATATSNDGVKTIADQQTDADKAIDAAAAKAKQAIDADKTLTDADKQAQKDVIDGQADMFKKAINSADNADDINKDTATGVKFLQDLTDAKTQADAKLASDVQNAHDAVNNNKALSQAQKDARNKQI